MEIYLVRHTQPAVEKGICYGQTDLELTDTFFQEAEVVRSKLNLTDKGFSVYSSPLKRCLKLAQYLFPEKNIRIDSRIKELYFGDWEMKNWDEIEKAYLDNWMKNFVQSACPNGESFNDLYQRCCHFLEELPDQEHQKVVVFTHGGVIRSILSHIHQIPLEQAFSIKVDYGSIHVVEK